MTSTSAGPRSILRILNATTAPLWVSVWLSAAIPVSALAGQITGKVTAKGGTPLQGVVVRACDPSCFERYRIATDAGGNYTIPNMEPDTYTIRFDVEGAGYGKYAEEWYSDKPDCASATPVVVGDGTTSGIDAEIATLGGISGRVKYPGGGGVEGVSIRIYDPSDLGPYYNPSYPSSAWPVARTETDSAGGWAIRGLTTGSYRVEMYAHPAETGYLSEYYHNAGDLTAATPVAVSSPAMTGGIDAELAPGGRIAGRVTDGAGNGIPDVKVGISGLAGGCSTATDPGGFYVCSGLASGDYTIEFNGLQSGYRRQWYSGETSSGAADKVTLVAPATRTGIDAVLARGATLTVCKPPGTCAFATINEAVAAAEEGDTVSVQPGVYQEKIKIEKDAVTLQGAGADVTTIDGGGSGAVVWFEKPYYCRLDGFTITNGGPGIRHHYDNTIVSNCTITGNHSAFDGGGVSAHAWGVRYRNCLITGNSAVNGGGIASDWLDVADCFITNNQAQTKGGGVYAEGSSFSISGSMISGNSAVEGGGFYGTGSHAMTDTVLQDNSAQQGGGIFGQGLVMEARNLAILRNTAAAGGGIHIVDSDASFIDCQINGNIADDDSNSAFGGGVASLNGTPLFRNTEIADNRADAGGGAAVIGGGDFVGCDINGNEAASGGGLYLLASGGTIENCVVRGNSATSSGGGLLCSQSGARMVNTIFSGNAAADAGGGLYFDEAEPRIYHCSTSGNRASRGGGMFFSQTYFPEMVNCILWGDSPNEIGINARYRDGLVAFTDVQGGDPASPGSPWPGPGNTMVDPLFAAPWSAASAPTVEGDYTLEGPSPSIDAGSADDTAYPLLPDRDIQDEVRPQGPGFDQGADERYRGWPTVQFRHEASSGPESVASVSIEVNLSGAASTTVTVKYKTANGSAVAGSDYSARSGTLTFSPGVTSRTITVPILNNAAQELDERFTVTLTAPVNATLGSITKHTCTIGDDDTFGTIRLSSAVYSVNEGGSAVAITVQRIGGSGAVDVSYETADGTATAPGDFTKTSGILSWSTGDRTSKRFLVPIANDALDETNESFSVRLSTPRGGAVLGSPAAAIVTIVDNEPLPTIRFDGGASSGEESSSQARFDVSLSPASSRVVTVRYETVNRTAVAGGDYAVVAGTLTFNPGQTSKTIFVPIVNDTADEIDEMFAVALANPTNAVVGLPSWQVHTIRDDDGPPAVQFDLAASSGAESTPAARIDVVLVPASGRTVTVKYATVSGIGKTDARSGSDYSSRAGTLTFSPGQTRKTIAVPILNGAGQEPAETFTVVLSNPGNASLGANDRHTFTILDDDLHGSLRLSAANYAISEASARLSIRVQRIGGFSGPVSVNVTATDGTANRGSDYGFGPEILHWTNEDWKEKVIVVQLPPDHLDEPNETFTVALSAPTGGAILGFPITATVTIVDSDLPPTVRFSTPSSSAAEAGVSAAFGVSLSTGSAKTVTVRYATASGTALAGSDYKTTSGTLTFAAGETSKTFKVPIVDDLAAEPGQTFAATLSSPTNAVLGAPYRHVCTIVDNDASGADIADAGGN